MPNFVAGTDQGSLLSAPNYGDTFQNNIGPYAITYNGLKRPNTGVVAGDGTGDQLPTAFNKLLDNLDITLTSDNASIPNVALKLVVRAADGSINVGNITANSLTLAQPYTGPIYGGTW